MITLGTAMLGKRLGKNRKQIILLVLSVKLVLGSMGFMIFQQAGGTVFFAGQNQPQIEWISQTIGWAGEKLVLVGSMLDKEGGTRALSFNGIQVGEEYILEWSSDYIITEVPSEAVSGPLEVTVNGQKSNAVSFLVFKCYGEDAGCKK